MNPLAIVIYSDLICPWCYIGRRRLGQALQIVELSEPPSIVWRPFQLNPDLPKAGLDPGLTGRRNLAAGNDPRRWIDG